MTSTILRLRAGVCRFVAIVPKTSVNHTQQRSLALWRTATVTQGCPTMKIQKRTWFGFGMPKDAAELLQDGQPTVPIYSREPEDDSAEHLSGNELWTAEERADREDIARELYKMADTTPPVPLTQAFYERVFATLMKYDDWRGVKTARSLAVESGVTLDDNICAQLDTYLEEAEKRSYHEDSGW